MGYARRKVINLEGFNSPYPNNAIMQKTNKQQTNERDQIKCLQ